MLIDAHTHLRGQELEELEPLLGHHDLFLAPNGDCPEQCVELAGLAARTRRVLPSAGIHPWKADAVAFEDMCPWLTKAAFIGEIGLDNVWCDVALPVQRRVFLQQLELAEALQKPVILHTKGCEAEIADTLKPFTMRKLVHWYSCADHLRAYMEQGCWFTLGPQLEDPAVVQVASLVSLDKLLLETDGFDAVEWATGERVEPSELRRTLLRMVEWLAALRGLSVPKMERQLHSNFNHWTGHRQPNWNLRRS